jgi:hypothetical protein
VTAGTRQLPVWRATAHDAWKIVWAAADLARASATQGRSSADWIEWHVALDRAEAIERWADTSVNGGGWWRR